MSDADEDSEIEEIRRQKRAAIESRLESPDEPIHVEGMAHFEELLDDHGLVLVDFYADWCGPCKMLEPTVRDVAAGTDAAVAKVDIDAHQALASEYQVQGVPTIYLFEDGETVQRWVGVQDEGTLVSAIESRT